MIEPYRAALHSTSNYIVVGQVGKGNILDNGPRVDGSELIDSWLDVVRKEAENCDCLQGIQSCQFLGGGTGSDLGDSSFAKMHEEHLDRNCDLLFFQSPTVSDTGGRAVLRRLEFFLRLVENADEYMLLGAEALYDICFTFLKLVTPIHGEVNHIVSG